MNEDSSLDQLVARFREISSGISRLPNLRSVEVLIWRLIDCRLRVLEAAEVDLTTRRRSAILSAYDDFDHLTERRIKALCPTHRTK